MVMVLPQRKPLLRRVRDGNAVTVISPSGFGQPRGWDLGHGTHMSRLPSSLSGVIAVTLVEEREEAPSPVPVLATLLPPPPPLLLLLLLLLLLVGFILFLELALELVGSFEKSGDLGMEKEETEVAKEEEEEVVVVVVVEELAVALGEACG